MDWLSGDTEYQPERSETFDSIEFLYFYNSKDKNVFTQENLKAIQETENEFFNNEEFKKKYCYLVNGACKKMQSIIRFFDGTYAYVDPIFNDPNFKNIPSVLYHASYYNETKLSFYYHLGRDAVVTETEARSYATRSVLDIGYPLKGYNSTNDRDDEQQSDLKEFYRKVFIKEIGEPKFKSGINGMEFVYNSGTIIGITILTQVCMLQYIPLTFLPL